MRRRYRVLVVEDDAATRTMLTVLLDLEEFEVVVADSGSAALEVLERDPIDLVVLDVMLPDLDGLTVLRRIREQPSTRDLPVVVLTALDSEEDRVAGKQAGADAYLTKPFSPLELIEVLHDLGIATTR